jgi:hypothetical protein
MTPLIFPLLLHSVTSQVTCQEPPLRSFNFTIVSNYFTQLISSDMTSLGQAVHCWVHPAWTASVPGATWIWDTYKDGDSYRQLKFQAQFYIPGVPTDGNLRLAADNDFSVMFNGQDIGCAGSGFSAGSEKDCSVFSYLVTGLNTLIISVFNWGGPGSLIYRLDVTADV